MTRAEVEDYCEIKGVELLLADGHDNAIVGIANRHNATFVLYDKAKVIRNLMADSMTYEEAKEFFEYNVIGAWEGETTPAFLEGVEEEP